MILFSPISSIFLNENPNSYAFIYPEKLWKTPTVVNDETFYKL